MDEALKEKFDIIVLGTGLVESLVAAAAARIGKKVLHLDKNDFYGDQWASFSLNGLEDWANSITQSQVNNNFVLDKSSPDGETQIRIKSLSNFSGVECKWHIIDNIDTKEIVSDNEDNEEEIAKKQEKNILEEISTRKNETHIEENLNIENKLEIENVIEETQQKETDPKEFIEESSLFTSKEIKNNQNKPASQWTKELLRAASRRFNIDLAPKVLYARGPFVELLISSNVARYVEFKCVSRILTSDCSSPALVRVPCSRGEVFTTESISLVEKRILMKFLQWCQQASDNQEEWKAFSDKPFSEFLATHRLTPRLIHFVVCAMAMMSESGLKIDSTKREVDEDQGCLSENKIEEIKANKSIVNISTCRGLERAGLFLRSAGRFGPLPFLFPLYGAGEMPQAFCRLCAVFEGLYILRQEIQTLSVGEEGAEAVLASDGRRFCGKNFLFGASYELEQRERSKGEEIARAILITDKSLSPSEKEELTLARVASGGPTVTVIELAPGVAVCPKDTNLVHLTAGGVGAADAVKGCADELFNLSNGNDENTIEMEKTTEETSTEESKPKVLFSLFFNQQCVSDSVSDVPCNVRFAQGPSSEADMEDVVDKARSLFLSVFPGEEFLPRAPDADQIDFGEADEEEAKGEEEKEIEEEIKEEKENIGEINMKDD